MTDEFKTYPWVKLQRTSLEARVYCPKCGTSKTFHGDDNPFFWESELKYSWVVTQCDSPKCGSFFELKKRRDGVIVRLQ